MILTSAISSTDQISSQKSQFNKACITSTTATTPTKKEKKVILIPQTKKKKNLFFSETSSRNRHRSHNIKLIQIKVRFPAALIIQPTRIQLSLISRTKNPSRAPRIKSKPYRPTNLIQKPQNWMKQSVIYLKGKRGGKIRLKFTSIVKISKKILRRIVSREGFNKRGVAEFWEMFSRERTRQGIRRLINVCGCNINRSLFKMDRL